MTEKMEYKLPPFPMRAKFDVDAPTKAEHAALIARVEALERAVQDKQCPST